LLVLVVLLQYVFMEGVLYRNTAFNCKAGPGHIPARLGTIPHGFKDDLGEGPHIFAPGTSLAFIDSQGHFSVLFTDRRHGNTPPPMLDAGEYLRAMQQRGRELNYRIIDEAPEEQLVVLQPIYNLPNGPALGVVQISNPTGPLKGLLLRQLLVFLLLSLIAMLVGLLGFVPVIKRTLVPLSNMVDTARQIDAGNLARRFPTGQGQAEIDHLAESFNGMLERLEESFAAERETKEQMRRFVADASHELRTPLTSIYGFLEVLLRGAANQPDQLDKALKSMLKESQRLNKLVNDLLLLNKLDSEPFFEIKEGLLDEVIWEMEPQLRILAGSRQLDLEIEPEMKCRFNTDRMKQVVLNLFQNAVEHTSPENGQIRLILGRKEHGVELAVEDNGPGISKPHLPYVFDRFYRIDSSRTRRYGGAGLGLSITKSIIEAHGGTINVTSEEGAGCTFAVWLPE
jgi:two-component system OmpR family sensor kinase